jgi:DNA repair exonuclease SbcCD nuclease subunit
MAKLKFIHTADLHLDTPFRSLRSLNGELADRLKDATVRSFDRIIHLCLEEQVDFLLVSGDIFDSESKSLAAQLRFIKGLQKLSDHGIPTYFICGNHDPLDSWLESLEMPEKVYRFDSSRVEKVVFEKEDQPVVGIYGISYRTKNESRNLAEKFHLTGPPLPFSIALLHATTGNPGPHVNYAPFKAEEIVSKGFDYWALGHIHKRQVLRGNDPAIVYPGNPQGRDFGETGSRGCMVVEMESGSPPVIRFVPTQEIRFEQVRIDLSDRETINDLAKLIEKAKTEIPEYDESTSYILRIILSGRTSLHSLLNKPGEMEAITEELNEGQLSADPFTWIDSISAETQPHIDEHSLAEGNDFSAEVLKALRNLDPAEYLNKITEETPLPSAVTRLVSLSDDETKKIAERVKWMLLDKLVKDD